LHLKGGRGGADAGFSRGLLPTIRHQNQTRSLSRRVLFYFLLDDRCARKKRDLRDRDHIRSKPSLVSLMTEPPTGAETTRRLTHRSTGLEQKELRT
jgi:hypothetical protein